MFGIHVKFYNKNTREWSRAYTYLHNDALTPDSKVIVANGSWYAIGRVVRSQPDFVPNPQITYKKIIKEVQI
jgi:hypothetical protein